MSRRLLRSDMYKVTCTSVVRRPQEANAPLHFFTKPGLDRSMRVVHREDVTTSGAVSVTPCHWRIRSECVTIRSRRARMAVAFSLLKQCDKSIEGPVQSRSNST